MKYLEAKRLSPADGTKRERTAMSDKMDRRSLAKTQNKSTPTKESDEVHFASDEAEELANESGVDLTNVKGSGKDGGFTVADVREAIEREGR